MSIDAIWPDGREGNGAYFGHARDLLTPFDESAPPLVLAEDSIHARADFRTIVAIESDPPRPALAQLVGARAGGHLRAAIEQLLPGDRDAGTPLYLLLDDMAGATLVSGWAFSRWTDAWMGSRTEEDRAAHVRAMEGVCIGFRPGSAALGDQGRRQPEQNATPVVPLPHPDDPAGWHPLVDRGGINFRRARRIDLWREGGRIHIDSSFQDSASAPDGGRVAVHEYRLLGTADAASGTLLSLDATPGTLPYKECPAAPVNLRALIGTPLHMLRAAVLVTLRKSAGCTHLNDAVRALAEVPQLAARLPSEA
jgi:hypothetical protein